jgi:hypothetical protein
MGRFVHCNVQYLYFYFLMLLFIKHCNDFDLCEPSIGQYNSYSYSYVNCMPLEGGTQQVNLFVNIWIYSNNLDNSNKYVEGFFDVLLSLVITRQVSKLT